MSNITGYRTDRVGAYIDHDPDSRLDYTLDWSEWLASPDRLASSTWTASTTAGDSNPVNIETSTVDALLGTTTAIISGGTAGNIYTITCHIETDNSLVDERTFRLVVKQRSL